ncbi:amino acid permease-domain-containing protein [Paraphysoderma sedebokerense]|nr:amino acid permease-domain-containing protein [Paraphysoderma sedebokerense]
MEFHIQRRWKFGSFSRSQLLKTKSIESVLEEGRKSELKRNLSAWDLTFIGVGGIIGTGIFVLTGRAAAVNAGPAVVLSFLLAGIASMFAALCYSELASVLPIAGSAYTYSYATLGELLGWIIGWDLILEYLVIGAATVSVGFSGYFTAFFQDAVGITLPAAITTSPIIYDPNTESFHATGAIINLPAVVAVLAITGLLVRGAKESVGFNNVVVVLKVLVIVIFVCATIPFIQSENWAPFVPPNAGAFGKFGISGIFQGATTVFFSYIGFDAVSTAAQEARNPQRDLPIGILASLTICTTLYILVSLTLTGIVPYTSLNVPHPIAVGIQATDQRWLAILVELGAIGGLISVMLVSLMAQPRIFFAMSKDGLLPAWAGELHPVHKTPYKMTIVSGVACAICGGLLPIDILGELTSIGTLFAFVLVCLGVLILRRTRPDLPRAFKVPFGPYPIPLLGAFSSGLLLLTATFATIIRLVVWMALGLIVYFTYGHHHSRLRFADKMESGEVIEFDLGEDSDSSIEDENSGFSGSGGRKKGSGSGKGSEIDNDD